MTLWAASAFQEVPGLVFEESSGEVGAGGYCRGKLVSSLACVKRRLTCNPLILHRPQRFRCATCVSHTVGVSIGVRRPSSEAVP